MVVPSAVVSELAEVPPRTYERPLREPHLVESSVTEVESLRRRLVRLACDVHDGPMQSLTAAGYGVHQLKRRVRPGGRVDANALLEELDEILAELAGTERDLRTLISRLEQGNPEIVPLDEIVRDEVASFKRRCRIDVDVEVPGAIQLDSHSQSVAMRGVLREALTNIGKHSGATRVQIRADAGPDGILLEVEDDGRGFDPADAPEHALGLAGMCQRIDLLRGELDVLSRVGGPTVITARLQRWNGS